MRRIRSTKSSRPARCARRSAGGPWRASVRAPPARACGSGAAAEVCRRALGVQHAQGRADERAVARLAEACRGAARTPPPRSATARAASRTRAVTRRQDLRAGGRLPALARRRIPRDPFNVPAGTRRDAPRGDPRHRRHARRHELPARARVVPRLPPARDRAADLAHPPPHRDGRRPARRGALRRAVEDEQGTTSARRRRSSTRS